MRFSFFRSPLPFFFFFSLVPLSPFLALFHPIHPPPPTPAAAATRASSSFPLPPRRPPLRRLPRHPSSSLRQFFIFLPLPSSPRSLSHSFIPFPSYPHPPPRPCIHLSTMAALSSSAHPAEALLSRARQLSSSAYHRSRTATPPPSAPTAFAEGEEFNLSISRPASPSLPSATIASFTLHEHHRNSFNGHLREHSRKRSTPHMRSSSSSIGRPLSNTVSANSSVDNLTKADVADLSGENAVKPLSTERPSHILSFDNNACTHVPHGPGVCPTSRHSLTITAQPGDISLYSHSCVATSSHLHPVDAHRRHRSENSGRGGLVLDLLEALRHSDSDSARLTSAPPIESAPSPISQSGDAPTTIHTPSPHRIVQQRTRADSTPVPSSLAIASLVENTTTDDAAALSPRDAPTSPMSLTSAGLSIAATAAAEPGLKHDLNAPTLPESSVDHVPNGSSDQQAKDDTLPSSPTQATTTTADVTTPPTTSTNTVTHKRSRRSSKLFGKFVPKFLQTSLGPSNSVSQPPQSAHPTSSSPSPLSTLGRLGRSASFAGGSSSSLLSTRSVAKPDPVIEEDEEDSNKERAGLSDVAATSETASSETAPSGDDTLVQTGSPDISNVDSGCDQTLESDRQEEAAEDDADGYQYNIVKETDDYHSPYIIDENCDDDFFLNSVLRKKSQPSSPSMLSTAWSSSPSLERMPSLTFSTISTTSSHSSLTSSTSSPTTPTHSSSTVFGASAPRSYPLPVMIQPGLDEKRSRLTDAVREWRRSTNASAGSVHSSYSGFAM
ncbi:MAG: hypothetical protein J3Q66DRAFT_354909 [Benniella sp.]|nr:MAG: hypothetical protein J3Q66DRAFT_354909 [Benniella sp.]